MVLWAVRAWCSVTEVKCFRKEKHDQIPLASINRRPGLPIILFDIVVYAFTLSWDNLSWNSCINNFLKSRSQFEKQNNVCSTSGVDLQDWKVWKHCESVFQRIGLSYLPRKNIQDSLWLLLKRPSWLLYCVWMSMAGSLL